MISRWLLCLWLVVILQWDPNTESDLSGYRVYRDGQLIGTVPKESTTFTDSEGGALYFVRAFNTTGQESKNSNLVVIGPLVIY